MPSFPTACRETETCAKIGPEGRTRQHGAALARAGEVLEKRIPSGWWVTKLNNEWDQRRGETSRQFAAFQCYLQLGSDRTLIEAARKLFPHRNAETTVRAWRKFSKRNQWESRAAAYDSMVAEKKRAAYERGQVLLEQRRIEFEERLQDLIEKHFNALDQRISRMLALPPTDVEQFLPDGSVKRIRGIRGGEIAALVDSWLEMAKCGVNGLREEKLAEKTPVQESSAPVPGTFRFIRPKKRANLSVPTFGAIQ